MKKKIALSALLLLAPLAGFAQSYIEPIARVDYTCHYTNPPAPSLTDGLSFFDVYRSWDPSGKPKLSGIEYFDATRPGVPIYTDNRKVTFAKPSDNYIWNGIYGWGTRWEFTINPSGPQCKSTDVFNNGQDIVFANCTDGHTRTCHRLY